VLSLVPECQGPGAPKFVERPRKAEFKYEND